MTINIGDEVGRDIALVKAHALGKLELNSKGIGLFNGDHAVFADLVDGIGNGGTDRRIS